MHTATAITVLTRTGTHTGIHIAPPSRQPKPATVSRFDRSAIMVDAWKRYRAAVRMISAPRFDARRFAFCLGLAWGTAKADARRAAPQPVNLAEAVITYRDNARAEAINAELLVIEYSDALGHGPRDMALRAELAGLRI